MARPTTKAPQATEQGAAAAAMAAHHEHLDKANARLDQIETTVGTSPKLRMYTGAMPADCATGIR